MSRNGLLAINNADTVLVRFSFLYFIHAISYWSTKVWNLGILTAQESPVPPHTTVHCDSTVAITCWLHNNCLATHFTKQIDIWDVNTAISATHERTFQFHYRESNIYTPLRSIHTSHTLTCLCPSNQLLLAGDSSGNVHILDPTNGNCLQVFSKPPHVSTVTDICAVSPLSLSLTSPSPSPTPHTITLTPGWRASDIMFKGLLHSSVSLDTRQHYPTGEFVYPSGRICGS